MRKIKALIAALVVLCSASLFADDFDWSECWCNYGAGIKQGDMILSADVGLSYASLGYVTDGFWFTPAFVVDFQVVQPIWKLPFSFGGYIGYNAYGYKGSDSKTYNFSNLMTGAIVSYHIMLPPENLDVYASTKVGCDFIFSSGAISGVIPAFDCCGAIGASWYFTDLIGINLEFGYPVSKFGVVFKF